jgi:uncharacterized protein YcbK (DUF882 family)
MLAATLELKLAAALMGGWFQAATPVVVPTVDVALAVDAHVSSPVEVVLHDANRRGVEVTVVIRRDGTADPETTKQLTHLFRCRSEREKAIATRTLAMLADVSDHFEGKPIEFVSGYRVTAKEPADSPHRAGRAVDFRIKGVSLRELRDYIWQHHAGVGVGWYPSENFVHLDSRPVKEDIAWTFIRGTNHYNPTWADTMRNGKRAELKQIRTRPRPGV